MHIDGAFFRLKEMVDAAALPFYFLRGRPPWSLGYYTMKRSVVRAAIDQKIVMAERRLPDSFGIAIDERAVEFPWLFERLRRLDGPIGRVLDAGSTLNHDFILDRDPLRKADLTIMTLAPEKRCYWDRGYSYVFGDLRHTNFKDGSFDTVVSISTLEHVGLDNTLLYTKDPAKAETDEYGFVDAIREFRRILAPGGRCLITVPFGKYENFGWFHIFDKAMLELLIGTFSPSSFEVEFFQYSKMGWQRASETQVVNATAFDPHSGRGRRDDRAGCARAIACIQLVR
jgi:SAM-dependent methyltransferase